MFDDLQGGTGFIPEDPSALFQWFSLGVNSMGAVVSELLLWDHWSGHDGWLSPTVVCCDHPDSRRSVTTGD